MGIKRTATTVLLIAILAFAGHLPAADNALSTPPSPLAISPFPSLTDYAIRHKIATEGIALAPNAREPHPGDEVIILVELNLPGRQRQWLVRLSAGKSDPGSKPADIPDDVIYTSTGRELRYTHRPAVLTVEFIGPFERSPGGATKVAVHTAQTFVSAESLAFGLFDYCASSLAINERLKAAGIESPMYYGVGRPPKADAVESGRRAAEAFGLTADEERLAFSVFFALRSFYQAASGIPACRDLLEQVIQKPSLWSVATKFGVNPNFTYGWQLVRALPASHFPPLDPVYVVPMRLALNDTPALRAEVVVTNTHPPLRNSAGIVALVAGHPTDDNKFVLFRLLSARVATATR